MAGELFTPEPAGKRFIGQTKELRIFFSKKKERKISFPLVERFEIPSLLFQRWQSTLLIRVKIKRVNEYLTFDLRLQCCTIRECSQPPTRMPNLRS